MIQPRRALWAAIGILLLAFVLSPRVVREMRDFEVYWTAANRALASAPLYRAEDGHYQFKYLPAFAVAAIPIAAMPLPLAKQVWLVLCLVSLVAVLALSVRLLPERRRPAWLLVAVMFVTMAKFYGHELVLGQVNLLFTCLVLCALLALQKARDGTAAALLVAALVVKPYAALFLPWLALTRGAAAVVSAGLVLLFVLGLPVTCYGLQGAVALHRDWWTTVRTSTAPNLTNPDNVSLAGFAAKWWGEAGVLPAAAAVIALLLVACAVVYKGRGIRGRTYLEGALLLTVLPLVSPQGWDYLFLTATPAVAIWANYDDRLPLPLRALTWLALGVVAFSIYDVLGRELYAKFMALSIVTICFVIVVAALAALRFRRVV